jgi:hypothetical protein
VAVGIVVPAGRCCEDAESSRDGPDAGVGCADGVTPIVGQQVLVTDLAGGDIRCSASSNLPSKLASVERQVAT